MSITTNYGKQPGKYDAVKRASAASNGSQLDYVRIYGLVVPEIEDDYNRFVIREFQASDFHRLCEMNEGLFFVHLRHTYQGPIGFLNAAIKQQKMGRDRKDFFLAIADVATSEVIGCVMLYNLQPGIGQAEIGYFVDPTYQNVNVATDATVKMLVRLGSSLAIQKLIATVHPKNQFSRKLLARLGFKQFGDTFLSDYPGDPARKESYDAQGRLQKDPRINFVVDYGHFTNQKKKIITSHEDIQGMVNARQRRGEIVAEAKRRKRFFGALPLPPYTDG